MRLSPDSGIGLDGSTVKPTASWKPNKAARHYGVIAPGETLHFRIMAWIMLLAASVYILVFLRTPLADNQAWIMHTKGYMLLVGMHLLLAYLYGRASDFIDLGIPLRKLQYKVPREDAVPVEIKIRQSGVVTGCDQGYMWFDDEVLYYKGRQTAFRINRDDFPAATLMPRKERPDLGRMKFPKSLTLVVNDRKIRLCLKMIDPFEDFASRRKAQQFQIDLSDWILGSAQPAMESLLPPVEVHPSLIRKGWGKVEPLFGAGFLFALNVILCAAVLYGYQMGFVQGTLNHFAAGIHVGLLFISAWIAGRSWWNTKVREELVAKDSVQAL